MHLRSIGAVLLASACAVAQGSEWIPVGTLSSMRMSVSAVENSRQGDVARGVLRTEFQAVQHDRDRAMAYDRVDSELEINCARPNAQPVKATYYLKGKAQWSEKSDSLSLGNAPPVGRMIYQACTAGYTAPVLPPGWILTAEDAKHFGSIFGEPASRQGDHAAGRLRIDLRQPDTLENGLRYDRMEFALRFNCLEPVMEMMELRHFLGGDLVDTNEGRGQPSKIPVMPDTAAMDVRATACGK